MRKLSRSSLRRKADTLWSKVVRKKQGDRCWFCNEKPEKKGCLQAHHLFARSIYRFRYLLRNGMSLCAKCHRIFAGNKPLVLAVRIEERGLMTKEEILEMDRLSEKPFEITDEWYLYNISELEKELKRLESNNN